MVRTSSIQFTLGGRVPDRFTPTGLLIDLDGTLIDHESRISPRVERAVRAASALVPVAIVSGREPDDVTRFARMLGLTAPQVADNGARVVDPATGRTVYEMPMSAPESRRIVEEIEDLRLKYYAVDSGRVARSITQFTAWRVTVVAAHAVERSVCGSLISGLSSDEVQAVPSTDANGGYWYANFTRRGVSKGSAARYFSQQTGAALSGLVAVGDSDNDLPMFAEVGLPIAMGHARDNIKAAAKAVAGSISSDGLAEAVETFVIAPLS
jgi:hypothetical protein